MALKITNKIFENFDSLMPLIIFCLIFSSCCTKKDCDSNFQQITFKNFNFSELDSVLIETYEANSNFSTRVDSVSRFVLQPSIYNEYSISLNNEVSSGFDYKFYILSLSKTYELTTIIFEKEKCNQCFLGINQDYYEKIKSYKLNGQQNENGGIFIYK